MPRVINTDKNPAYGEAIAELKQEGTIPAELEHREAKYCNNRLECAEALDPADARLPVDEDGYATIKGFEVMRMFKKGQFTWWIDAIGGGTEART
jgi:transposase, IS6 family